MMESELESEFAYFIFFLQQTTKDTVLTMSLAEFGKRSDEVADKIKHKKPFLI